MSLDLYNKKRHFKETTEPVGKSKSSKGSLKFVVQKHDASHVHYDFRLEMEGVLKSWAVPKGPSLNPADKRLAMMVEDHPYDYRNFEGIIPEGNYGAGTVIVWDEGTYIPMDGESLSSKEQEQLLLKQLKEGNLKITLNGDKLKGSFALFQMKGRGERSWILVKKNDAFAGKTDITKKDTSVKSGKTLVQVAKANGTVVNHPEVKVEESKTVKASSKQPVKKAVQDKKPAGKKKAADIKALLGNTADVFKSSLPEKVLPMLATLVDEPFDSDEWLFEIKWDGYRAIATHQGKNTSLISRNLVDFTEKYKPIADALANIEYDVVLDGEIVAVDEKGMADFQSLQNWQNTPVHLKYFVFDILWLNGYNLTMLPLIERKRILKEVLPESEIVQYSDHVKGAGKDFFKVALDQGLEGIMGKKANSTYQFDARTGEWLKIKVNMRQEVVIAGYTEPRNTRVFFGSLLLGVYEKDQLRYVGHTGSGFNKKSLEAIYKKLQSLVTDQCPFQPEPKTNMPATWVKPKLVCEIKFTEWTKENMARHPIFMGLRTDKKPKDVNFEKAKHMAKSTAKTKGKVKTPAAPKKAASKKPASKSAGTQKKSPLSKGEQQLLDPANGNDQLLNLNGHELKITNLSKIYWKKESFTKGDMLNYYKAIVPYMLPYMLNRPQSLNRHPNGIQGPNFFQKDVKGKVPEWMETFMDFSESTQEQVEYLVCTNEATLLYMANLGCIEMHPWHSRTVAPLKPDWCLIDLDPDKSNPFDQVMQVAKTVKKLTDTIGADAYCKTSGATGIHIYLPLGAQYSYEQSKQLAELIVTWVHQELPDITSMERSPAKRKGKIYLDYLQNRETQTAAAPYSLRPKPGVPVSTPLDWSELKKGLTPATWNARNIFERLKKEGDLFRPVLGKGINLEKVLKKMQASLG